MKTAEKGIVRKIEGNGRFVIPKPYVRNLGLEANDKIKITYTDDDKIVISKHYEKCIICNSEDYLIELNDKLICQSCVAKLNLLKDEF